MDKAWIAILSNQVLCSTSLQQWLPRPTISRCIRSLVLTKPQGMRIMEMLVRQDFEPYLCEPFIIHRHNTSVDAQLIEIRPLGKPFRADAREPFSLLFEASAGFGMLHQGLYSVSNPSLGEKTIFLVPVEGKNNCYQYEAVFN